MKKVKEIKTTLGETLLEYLKQRKDMSDGEKNKILDLLIINNCPMFFYDGDIRRER